MPNDTFGGAKTLLDALFHEKEQHLLNAFRESLERMDRRTQLAQVSGIHDEALPCFPQVVALISRGFPRGANQQP